MAWYLKSIPQKSSQKNPFRRENISNECPYNVLKIHSAGFPWISHIIYLFIYLCIYLFIYVCMYLLIYLFIYVLIYLFIYVLIYLYIYIY